MQFFNNYYQYFENDHLRHVSPKQLVQCHKIMPLLHFQVVLVDIQTTKKMCCENSGIFFMGSKLTNSFLAPLHM